MPHKGCYPRRGDLNRQVSARRRPCPSRASLRLCFRNTIDFYSQLDLIWDEILFRVVTLTVPIEFDTAKRMATLEARGLDMARADEVLAGATLTVEDDRQDYREDRFITIGFLDATMVVLVWTPRDGAHRIISMRKANERERTLYGPRF